MESQNTGKNYERPFFNNLNGLRFVGALSVLLFHSFTLNREIWGDFFHTKIFKLVYKIMDRGYLGINLFFVLSGFLITYLLLNELKSTGKINVFGYLVRRSLRIWPLYYLIVIFGFFIFPHLPYGIQTIHEFWRYALFLSNFDELIHGLDDPINFLSATWTVSVEEQFYIGWGILIGFLRFRKINSYLLFFGSIFVLSLLFRLFHAGEDRLLYYHTFSVMSDLTVGGTIGLLAFQGKIQPFFQKLSKKSIYFWYLLGISAVFGASSLHEGLITAFTRIVPELFFAFVVLEQVYAKNSFYKLDRIPGFSRAGELTYGFYMYHSIFIYYGGIFFQSFHLTSTIGGFLLYLVLVFVATYITAWISYRYFEQPFLKLKRFFR